MKSSIIAVLYLLGLTCAGAALLPAPDTPYRVRWTSEELVDHDRMDPFNSSHPRRLMISRFTPVRVQECVKSCQVRYMEPLVAKDMDRSYRNYLGSDWPDNVFGELEIEVCCEDKARQSNFPLVLFGPGFAASRQLFSSLAQHLSGMGFEVVVMDHPYETNVVVFPDGTVINGGRVDYNETAELGLDVRSADASFVLNALRIGRRDKVAMIGMSFGGAAAAITMLDDSRIVGGVNLDGSMYGRALDLGTDRPFLIIGSTGHNSSAVDLDGSWARFWQATEKLHPSAWMTELNLAGSIHATFSDSGPIGDVTGLRDIERLRQLAFGQITGARAFKILREYLSDFMRFSLGLGREGLLAGPSSKYPDVIFFRQSQPSEL
ncbi:hypothetical protein S7711_03783 [Stachybotrys chartarum IBT 7711]|uniref:1-alkyl-2-acetylglycerophosphocholine esterase n=1 Tax=Stachybotrys chartarum (strain CBS 109288 / IBT 7711) TaxID=1280523 RepID=A0A084AU63_STACB|nr:hypothetical protein S7711_03783 [Stachybotrys chartarum IBT 7711]KFA46913.1 hypothetical protein S40293_03644 [Stachybotrys chartarum IBT 40293]